MLSEAKTFAADKPYVFLSYARPDQAAAEQVEAFLTAAGLRVFRDTSDIGAGDNWDMEIEQALRACQRMVLLLSRHSMPYRKEVHREWFYFDQQRKPIYPLFLADCDLHSRFASLNYLDARADLPEALTRLLAALRGSAAPPVLTADSVTDNLTEYRRNRLAEWSLPRYRLDKRFVNLTLLLDKGESEAQRWHSAENWRFDDLREVLAKTGEHPALVLLGAPGSGKSTLLRRLQLDHSDDLLHSPADEISFFVQLNEYHGAQPPREWLSQSWRARYPQLPPLDSYLGNGQALLLLDALNEMQPGGGSSYDQLIRDWRAFVVEAARCGNRILFSCRSLDYSASLSSKDLRVPQIAVQPMTPEQLREFLHAYVPARAGELWEQLDGAPQFDLYRTPYFLKLLCEQVEATGAIPQGRAGLFTGFVRKALAREAGSELLQDDALLSERDRRKLTLEAWADPFALPEHGHLLPKLSELAFKMQQHGMRSESAQVKLGYDEALALLAHERAGQIVKAGLALNVLDEFVARDELAFFHQLLQEYFAARRLAKAPQPELVHVEWEAEKVSEPLKQTLAGLADGDPLPPLPQTGWEETTLTAAPMASAPEQFIRALIPHNLPLAARCATTPEVSVSETLKAELREELKKRSQDFQRADLRARIAAGEALGSLGDPRFERRTGPHGAYLAPPLVAIPGGEYTIGDDKSDYDFEKPAHKVTLAPFQIGRFHVTNAEYALFIEAGGYDDERWWDTAEALAWLREGGSEGPKEDWRDWRKTTLQSWTENYIRGLVKQNRITSEQADDWIIIRNWPDERFEQQLDEWYPAGKLYREPEYWNDTRFNNPAQPVVGVTWYEARAYCNWLTANVADGKLYRLPTEAEFEAAARGQQGRPFPFGKKFDKDRCNTFESHIRRTTPVGIFDNATPEGAFDLSGNAYTWTLSIYDQQRFPYPYRSDDGREDVQATNVKRDLRGGAWFNDIDFARAVSRDISDPPGARGVAPGFRVVVLRPPSLKH